MAVETLLPAEPADSWAWLTEPALRGRCWQPYEHVAWRLRIGGAGPIDATADLERVADGTRLVLRWSRPTEPGPIATALTSAAGERVTAIERLARMLGRRAAVQTATTTDPV